MSRDASVNLDYGDDTYVFRLAWGQMIELQEACDAGPQMILRRFSDGNWRVQDISNTLRLGLIGGGMEPVKALKLVRTYCESRPPLESLLFAQAVLQVGLMGAPDEPQKKSAKTPKKTTISPTAKSASPQSTGPAPS